MEIRFLGHACFSIKTDAGTVVTDPYQQSIGLKLPSVKGDVVTMSHHSDPYNNANAVEGDPGVFDWPGEYETGGIHFKRVHSFGPSESENVVTLIHYNGFRLCHLGAQAGKLNSEQLEQIGEVDILMIPVGGKDLLDAKKAKEVIEQIEPRVVIPMAYQTEGSTLGLDPVDTFLNAMGAASSEALDKFSVKRSELPEDNSRVVVLNVAA